MCTIIAMNYRGGNNFVESKVRMLLKCTCPHFNLFALILLHCTLKLSNFI